MFASLLIKVDVNIEDAYQEDLFSAVIICFVLVVPVLGLFLLMRAHCKCEKPDVFSRRRGSAAAGGQVVGAVEEGGEAVAAAPPTRTFGGGAQMVKRADMPRQPSHRQGAAPSGRERDGGGDDSRSSVFQHSNPMPSARHRGLEMVSLGQQVADIDDFPGGRGAGGGGGGGLAAARSFRAHGESRLPTIVEPSMGGVLGRHPPRPRAPTGPAAGSHHGPGGAR